MGMFNYVFWDGSLNGPMPEKQTLRTAFQSKSLFCKDEIRWTDFLNLDIYYVTDDSVYILPWDEYGNIDENGNERDTIDVDLEWLRDHVSELTPVFPDGSIDFYTTIDDKWVGYVAGYEDGMRMFCYLVRYGDKRLCDLIGV